MQAFGAGDGSRPPAPDCLSTAPRRRGVEFAWEGSKSGVGRQSWEISRIRCKSTPFLRGAVLSTPFRKYANVGTRDLRKGKARLRLPPKKLPSTRSSTPDTPLPGDPGSRSVASTSKSIVPRTAAPGAGEAIATRGGVPAHPRNGAPPSGIQGADVLDPGRGGSTHRARFMVLKHGRRKMGTFPISTWWSMSMTLLGGIAALWTGATWSAEA